MCSHAIETDIVSEDGHSPTAQDSSLRRCNVNDVVSPRELISPSGRCKVNDVETPQEQISEATSLHVNADGNGDLNATISQSNDCIP